MFSEFWFPSASKNGSIYAVEFIPDGDVRAVVQMTHGMAEHIRRYDGLGKFLNERGIAAVGMDLAGHGGSVQEGFTFGYFGEHDGWSNVIADMRTLYLRTKEKFPNIPYVLLGHSMGSFLARTYASRHGNDVDAFIFSGTAGKNPVLGIAKKLAQSQIKSIGAKTKSEKLNSLSFGAYNKAFRPNRTAFDWLSRDEAVVDEYVASDFCGFAFTSQGFADLFDGLAEIGAKDWAGKVPKKPILMIAGSQDPVGSKGKGVRQVAENLVATGHDVELHIYEGARHEIMLETNRDEVLNDIGAFLDKKVL